MAENAQQLQAKIQSEKDPEIQASEQSELQLVEQKLSDLRERIQQSEFADADSNAAQLFGP